MRGRLLLCLTCLLFLGFWTPATARVDPCAIPPHPPASDPSGPPGDDRLRCQAEPTETQRALPTPSPGYHHLGATTATGWAGVLGRLTVTDPAVREHTYDFVAARFLAKRAQPDAVHWLESGWAETGWSGAGRQRVYTFDSTRDEWRFYDQFSLTPGDRVWLSLTAGDDGTWQAWLWWGTAWHLLASVAVPLGDAAQIEQYVEVYAESTRPAVPPTTVDNVRLRTADGALRFWRADILTEPGLPVAPYCLAWTNPFDTWVAGDCLQS